MSRRLPSGSRWSLAFTCEASSVLQTVSTVSSPAAAKGIAVHNFLAMVGEIGQEDALATIPDPAWRKLCEAIDLDALKYIDPKSYAHEMPLAYDFATGRSRRLDQGDFEIKPTETLMILDIAGTSTDLLSVEALDYKTGYTNVPPPRENRQIQIGVLALARLVGATQGYGAIVRVRDDGSLWFDRDSFDSFDLDEIAEEFQAQYEKIEAAKDRYQRTGQLRWTIGEHCGWCPSFEFCPAKQERARALAHDANAVAFKVRQLLEQPATQPQAVLALIEMEQLRERMDKQVGHAIHSVRDALEKHVVAFGPIDMGGGKEWRREFSEVVKFDGRATFEILSKRYGEPTALAATKLTAPKASVEEAIKPFLAKGTVAKGMRDLEAELMALSAVEVKLTTEFGIFKAPTAKQLKGAA